MTFPEAFMLGFGQIVGWFVGGLAVVTTIVLFAALVILLQGDTPPDRDDFPR